MKKIIVVLVLAVSLCVGCDKIKELVGGKERTAEALLDQYIEAYMNTDFDKMVDIMPSFMTKNSTTLTKESLSKALVNSKEEFGDDFKITYEIKEKKLLSSEELSKLNDSLQDYFKTTESASECYYLDGTITFAGSKRTDPDPLGTYHCKYSGTWYLVIS